MNSIKKTVSGDKRILYFLSSVSPYSFDNKKFDGLAVSFYLANDGCVFNVDRCKIRNFDCFSVNSLYS